MTESTQKRLKPCVTEKSARLAELNQYTYLISEGMTKADVAAAFREMAGLVAVRVNLITQSSKAIRTKIGRIERVRPTKAIVTVPDGSQVAYL